MAEDGGLRRRADDRSLRTEVLQAFHRGRVHYNTFVDPQVPGYGRAVADMVARGMLPVREMTLHVCEGFRRTLHDAHVAGRCASCGSASSEGSCEDCGGFTSAPTLIDPYCDSCGDAIAFTTTVSVLRIDDLGKQLTAMWLRAELSSRVRYLAVGLPKVPLAHPTNWGIEGTDPPDRRRIDVYAERAMAWLYGSAPGVDPAAKTLDACVAAPQREIDELRQFHDIDNTFYLAVFWPAMFAATGVDPLPLHGLVVNELYTLDGAKLSTSQDHAIWAHEFLSDEDPAFVRLVGFDPVLVVRIMLSLLASGGGIGPVLSALTGVGTRAAASVQLKAA
jgi:methionyl-tRNA synthetase